MNKTQLIEQVANDAELTKAQAAKSVQAVFDAITGALKNGDQVSLIGFGSFSVTDRPARTGRNPRTSEEIQIPAARLPKFKPGKGLKDAVAMPKPAAAAKPKPRAKSTAAPAAPAAPAAKAKTTTTRRRRKS